MARLWILATATALLHQAYACPLYPALDVPAKRQSISTLSTSQISAFKPFTFFASAAYCQPSTTINWNCGANCNANAGFQPTASGGDGGDEQFWYVGFDPALNTVIVAHQGTDTAKLLADLTDADIVFEPLGLNVALFPGISLDILVHMGFADSHAKSAPSILSAVQKTLAAHPGASVTMVGHSLGAALALLDSVFLPLRLPNSTSFKTITYGMPRVGNQAFANYVDQHITSLDGGMGLTHINNKEDPIPIVPGRDLGFRHPSGEVHIQDSGAWDACPGQDNPSMLCIVGDVPNIFQSNETDHDGPYDGVEMGC